MKATGIVRRVDELGRVVLPIELRKTLHIEDKDPLEIFIQNDRVVLKKYEPACVFNGTTEDLMEYNGRKVSKKAIEEMAILAGIK